jgi:hypothetical protein
MRRYRGHRRLEASTVSFVTNSSANPDFHNRRCIFLWLGLWRAALDPPDGIYKSLIASLLDHYHYARCRAIDLRRRADRGERRGHHRRTYREREKEIRRDRIVVLVPCWTLLVGFAGLLRVWAATPPYWELQLRRVIKIRPTACVSSILLCIPRPRG